MNMTKQKSAAELRVELAAQTGKARDIVHGLFDEGTFAELGAYRRRVSDEYGTDNDFESVITGYGAIDGRLVYAFVQDFGNRKGAMSSAHADKICELYDKALNSGAPVIGVFDSAGAPVLEGAGVLDGYSRIMKKISDAKDMIPQIALVTGICAGTAAVMANMFDFVIADEENGSLYMKPPFLCGGNGGDIASAAKRGEVQITASNLGELLAKTRQFLNLIPSSADEGTVMALSDDELNRRTYNVDAITAKADYDMAALVKEIADDGQFFQLDEAYAPEIKIGLAQINSAMTGIVATSPDVNNGLLTANAADKAARFINFCSSFSIPLLTIVDSEGIETEEGTNPANYAALATAYSTFCGNSVTAIVGKAYGAAFSLLGSKAMGTQMVIALDRAIISVMKPDAAINFALDSKFKNEKDPVEAREALEEEWKATQGSPLAAAMCGAIDDIVASDELRMRIVSAFAVQ